MSDQSEKLIDNSISRYGLRTMEIIRYGKAVDAKAWIKHVPGEANGLMRIDRWIDDDLGMHHLLISWNAREMVEFQQRPVRYGVLWWISRGESMSYSIDLAACLYKFVLGFYPTKCWIKSLPIGAPDHLMIEGFTSDPPTIPLDLIVTPWMPERYVLVGIEKKLMEIEYKEGKYFLKGDQTV